MEATGVHSPRRIGRPLVGLALALLATQALGCLVLVAGAAGAGGVAYYMGALRTTLPGGPEAVARATDATFADLDVRRISSQATKLDAHVVGRTATDTKIDVSVESKGDNQSEVTVRIGVFGDEAMSRRVLAGIRKRL